MILCIEINVYIYILYYIYMDIIYIYILLYMHMSVHVYTMYLQYIIYVYIKLYIHVSHMEMSKGSEHLLGTWPACHRDKIWWVRFKTKKPGTLTPILSIPGWDIDPPNLVDSSNRYLMYPLVN
jgi:hypothetical protein